MLVNFKIIIVKNLGSKTIAFELEKNIIFLIKFLMIKDKKNHLSLTTQNKMSSILIKNLISFVKEETFSFIYQILKNKFVC